jgi:hypothetical protein
MLPNVQRDSGLGTAPAASQIRWWADRWIDDARSAAKTILAGLPAPIRAQRPPDDYAPPTRLSPDVLAAASRRPTFGDVMDRWGVHALTAAIAGGAGIAMLLGKGGYLTAAASGSALLLAGASAALVLLPTVALFGVFQARRAKHLNAVAQIKAELHSPGYAELARTAREAHEGKARDYQENQSAIAAQVGAVGLKELAPLTQLLDRCPGSEARVVVWESIASLRQVFQDRLTLLDGDAKALMLSLRDEAAAVPWNQEIGLISALTSRSYAEAATAFEKILADAAKAGGDALYEGGLVQELRGMAQVVRRELGPSEGKVLSQDRVRLLAAVLRAERF